MERVRDRREIEFDNMLRVVGNGDVAAGRALVAAMTRPVMIASLSRAPTPVRVFVAAAMTRHRNFNLGDRVAGLDVVKALVPGAREAEAAQRLSYGHMDLTEIELCNLPDLPDDQTPMALSALSAMDVECGDVARAVKAGRFARGKRDAKAELEALGGMPEDMLPAWSYARNPGIAASMCATFEEAGRSDLAEWTRRTAGRDPTQETLKDIVLHMAYKAQHEAMTPRGP